MNCFNYILQTLGFHLSSSPHLPITKNLLSTFCFPGFVLTIDKISSFFVSRRKKPWIIPTFSKGRIRETDINTMSWQAKKTGQDATNCSPREGGIPWARKATALSSDIPAACDKVARLPRRARAGCQQTDKGEHRHGWLEVHVPSVTAS